jgi:hypothetical protein
MSKSFYRGWRGNEVKDDTMNRPSLGSKDWWKGLASTILRGEQDKDLSTITNQQECRGFSETNDPNLMEEMIKNPFGFESVTAVGGLQSAECMYEPVKDYFSKKKNKSGTFEANSLIAITSCPYQGYGDNWFGNQSKPGFYPGGKILKDGLIQCNPSDKFSFKRGSIDAEYLCPNTKSGGIYYPNEQRVVCDDEAIS